MVELNKFLADILGARGILGVPPEIAADALRKTAIDFTTQTGIWEFNGMFLTQTNVQDYPIDVPEDARVASLKWIEVGGTTLSPNVPQPPMVQWGNNNPNNFYGGYGNTFTMEGREFVWLSSTPQDNSTVVRFCVALKPKQNACQLPDILYEDFNDAMTSGTAYRLYTIPKQDWSNAGLAMANLKEYNRWIARARLTKAQNYTQKTMQMTGSYF